MNICMLINQYQTEKVVYTTTELSRRMHNKGHNVCYIEIEDLMLFADGACGGMAVRAKKKKHKSREEYFDDVRSQTGNKFELKSRNIDIFFIRNDPADENESRSWAKRAGASFGQIMAEQGVLVLNDPHGLAKAADKMYFQQFPNEVRPRTIISRDTTIIKEFFEQENKNIILKPLTGSGGTNVFQVTDKNIKNMNQIIEAISKDGFVVAQEYIARAEEGDVRVFLVNGKILEREGKLAVMRRVSGESDLRSNISAGGTARVATLSPRQLEVVEIVKPVLIRDGIFFAGLDFIGDKLTEVNVLSPGGLRVVSELQKIDFMDEMINELERKYYIKNHYNHKLSNAMMAMY